VFHLISDSNIFPDISPVLGLKSKHSALTVPIQPANITPNTDK